MKKIMTVACLVAGTLFAETTPVLPIINGSF